MTREEKVVSEVGGTSMLPGNEHRLGAQTKGGRADPPLARIQKRADAAGLGGGLRNTSETLAGSGLQRGRPPFSH